MAKVLFIVANNGFQDKEFGIPYRVLTSQGHQCFIASGKGGTAIGVFGEQIVNTLKLSEITATEYDLLVFVGGGGAENQYYGDELYLKIAKEGKSVAAICIAPYILSDAGIYNGKEFTCRDDGVGTQIKHIEKSGAIFKNEEVVQDGKYITANGPESATKFAWKLVDFLKD